MVLLYSISNKLLPGVRGPPKRRNLTNRSDPPVRRSASLRSAGSLHSMFLPLDISIFCNLKVLGPGPQGSKVKK